MCRRGNCVTSQRSSRFLFLSLPCRVVFLVMSTGATLFKCLLVNTKKKKKTMWPLLGERVYKKSLMLGSDYTIYITRHDLDQTSLTSLLVRGTRTQVLRNQRNLFIVLRSVGGSAGMLFLGTFFSSYFSVSTLPSLREVTYM